MVKELTNDNFNEIIESDQLTVVKVGAEWCGPCKMVKPILERVSENAQDYVVGDIDADTQNELAKSLGVRSIPTTIFYKKGTELKRTVGAYTEDDLNSMINECKNMKI